METKRSFWKAHRKRTFSGPNGEYDRRKNTELQPNEIPEDLQRALSQPAHGLFPYFENLLEQPDKQIPEDWTVENFLSAVCMASANMVRGKGKSPEEPQEVRLVLDDLFTPSCPEGGPDIKRSSYTMLGFEVKFADGEVCEGAVRMPGQYDSVLWGRPLFCSKLHKGQRIDTLTENDLQEDIAKRMSYSNLGRQLVNIVGKVMAKTI